jgi:phenylacetate-CoA ligase
MHPIIARNIFHLQENLLGRSSFKILAELLMSETQSQEQIRQLQLRRLQQTIRSAYIHSPYWYDFMKSAQILPASISSLDDLKRFPLLTKDTIRDQREKMVWRGEGSRIQLVRTSGSTNEALEFYTSSTREAHINAARMRGHQWLGVRRGEKELYYWGSPIELNKQDRVKRVRDWLINDGLTNGFEVTSERLKGYYKQWLTWQPKCMFGYPSTLVLTVTMAESLGLDLKRLSRCGLEVIVTTSEMLSDVDRQLISDGFGVPVYDSYGLREAGLISHECEHGTMHCMDEQIILETIDPVTLKSTDGEGELVVTNLVSPAFPIIRYCTGDIVTLSNRSCSCGRNLSSIKVSGGRAVEFVVTKAGKWVVGYSFIYIARSVKGIVKFQVIQEKLGEIQIKVVVDNFFPADGIERVKTEVSKRLGGDDLVVVDIVKDIQPAKSGKYRPVISKVAEALYQDRNFEV